ncbi:histidine kinase,Response regulator receiver domain protein,histidine kinase [Caulobacter sp. AP07]|uniref:response regulator n=1 Tax=Caulobacter sp. AP07 TaxID=1144304 RepID=UPI000271ED80|nr:response regulator [Caulobacter sp. AP07]EJL35779.1 histidine kinase,Response regulator receiver domain protein,histidine kinase [Caulobacter sp. AP07]
MSNRPSSAGVTPEQLATLSHEFRTPLNGVLGMARLLEGTRLTAEQRTYVAALRESGDHLLSLVNDVLDFARLGATAIDLHAAPVDVENLLRQVSELLSPRAHEKDIEIAWAAAPGLPTILADEGRLRQVLLNYAGNAIKFTETGGVLLSADLTGDGRVRFSVRDTGPGVEPEKRAAIFEAFVQTDPSHQAQLGGAGLGLAIVARLAAAMQGEAGVGGELGQGADFWFEAPFETVPVEPAELPLVGRCVAIASPNAMIREAAIRQIRASGGQALSGSSVAEALKGAPAEAVLLLDAVLAGPRGALRPPADRACVVLLTPDQRDRIGKLKAAGFSGYLIKPLRRASLIAQVLEARAAARTASVEVAAPAASSTPDDDRIAPAAAPGVRVLLAEDNPINALLARALLEREGCKVDRIASGDEAVSALSRGFYDLILMDLRMPGLNGIEATKALRERGVTTPIVALTADAFDEDRRACLAAGMNDFLAKPLTPSALRGVLTNWTGLGWTKAATRAKVAS